MNYVFFLSYYYYYFNNYFSLKFIAILIIIIFIIITIDINFYMTIVDSEKVFMCKVVMVSTSKVHRIVIRIRDDIKYDR